MFPALVALAAASSSWSLTLIGPNECPGSADVRREVARLQPDGASAQGKRHNSERRPKSAPSAASRDSRRGDGESENGLVVSALIRKVEGRGYVLRLVLERGPDRKVREAETQNCESLTKLIALNISLELSPTSEPMGTRDDGFRGAYPPLEYFEEPQVSDEGYRLQLGALLDGGILPHIGAGPWARLSIPLGMWRIGLGGRGAVGTEARVNGVAASFNLAAAMGEGCVAYRVHPRVTLSPCLGGELGMVVASGLDTVRAGYVSGFLGVQSSFFLIKDLDFVVRTEAQLVLHRPRFFGGGETELLLHQPNSIAARAYLGFSWRLFD